MRSAGKCDYTKHCCLQNDAMNDMLFNIGLLLAKVGITAATIGLFTVIFSHILFREQHAEDARDLGGSVMFVGLIVSAISTVLMLLSIV
jgi:hypothetical protein